jgi:predicted TIM-barrel fold metal-dependent hydrolase
VAEAVAKHSNLLFGASVNPYRKDWRARLVWAKAHGAVLVKWIPSVMNIDPSDPKLIPFYEKLKELKLPLLTHTGQDQSIPSSNDELNDPERLRLPLSLGVKVIAAHIASTGSYHREGGPPGIYHRESGSVRLARMMRDNTNKANLFADISSLTQINKPGYMKKALTWREFSGKLYYGSDYPLINTMLVSPWYYCFRLTPMQVISIALTKNPWDMDVKLKQALGTPTDVFASSQAFLRR